MTIAVGPLHVVVCVPPNAFYCGHLPTDTAVIPVPFAPAFAGATSVTYLDGYFVYSGVESAAQFFISGLQDPTSYDALDFANADAFPALVTRVMALHGDVWIVGESGLEAWCSAGSSGLETMPGTSFFPFRRRTGGMIAIPAARPRSIALGDGSVWWVGRDDAVYRTQGYQAKRVSTHAVERAVYEASGFTALGAGDGSGAFSITNAYCYMERGHLFYVLSFLNTTTMDPVTGGITLAYDANTDKWHDRASGSGGTGRWRGHAAAQYGDWVIFGDYNDGTIWRSIPELGTEGSMQPLRSFTLPPLWAGTKRAFCPRLEIELDVASASAPGAGDAGMVGRRRHYLGRLAGVADRRGTGNAATGVYDTARLVPQSRIPRLGQWASHSVCGRCRYHRRGVLMALAVRPVALQPPANTAPIADDGTHSQAWAGFHEDVATLLNQVRATVVAKTGVTDGSDATAGQVGEYLQRKRRPGVAEQRGGARRGDAGTDGRRLGCERGCGVYPNRQPFTLCCWHQHHGGHNRNE